jgi:ribosomal protein L40E
MAEPTPGKSAPAVAPQRFQQVDADAVCERCGAVNDDATLICRVCGQNLRDQRVRRLASAQAPAALTEKVSRVRVFTGVLSVLGILLVVVAAVSIRRIEAGLTNALSEQPIGNSVLEDLYSGPSAAIYDELTAELRDFPSTRAQIQDTLDNPVAEASYNGRYVLLRQGALTPDRVIGEAVLRRRDDRVYFVAQITRPAMEVRGFARLEAVQESGAEAAVRPVVRNTAGYINDAGVEVRGFGLAEPIEAGGHRVMAMQTGDGAEATNVQAELFAYRIR